MVLHPCRGSFCNSLHLNDYDSSTCSIVEGNPCNSCKELAELDAEISCAYDHFKNLARKRQILKAKVNRNHDRLIQHLPVELISWIFTILVEDIRTTFLEDYPTRSSTGKTNNSAPFILAAVCRKWREITFATPQLWTTVNIYLQSIENFPLEEELVKGWLGRSGRLPLKIFISITGWEFDSSLTTLNAFFDAVRDYAPRWQGLALEISPACYDVFIGDITSAPSLETLRLQFDGWRHYGSEPFRLPETPVLTDFRINNTILDELTAQWGQWTNLRVLEMECLNVDEVIEVLHRGQRLEKGIFADIYPAGGGFPTTPVTHRSLKDLELKLDIDMDESNTRLLLNNLTLPSLDRFVYTPCLPWVLSQADALISLFSRSQCKIKTFEFDARSDCIADDAFIHILRQLPSLRRLSLVCRQFQFDDIEVSMWTSSEVLKPLQVNFLPLLEDVQFSGHRAFYWNSFLQSMKSIQLHISDTQQNTAHDIPSNPTNSPSALPAPEKQRNHMNVVLKLDRGSPSESDDKEFDDGPDYIDIKVVSDLAAIAKMDTGISLRIVDEDGIDLIQASLLYHGLASENGSGDESIG